MCFPLASSNLDHVLYIFKAMHNNTHIIWRGWCNLIKHLVLGKKELFLLFSTSNMSEYRKMHCLHIVFNTAPSPIAITVLSQNCQFIAQRCDNSLVKNLMMRSLQSKY